MGNLKNYIQAARLRTLPLSISGIIVGCSLALKNNSSGTVLTSAVFWLAIATTLGLQIVSNFANDYGDGVRGTDKNKVGETRVVAAGIITPNAMKMAIIYSSIFTLCTALVLIYIALSGAKSTTILAFVGLGLLSLIAAITYTVGKNAYGYLGLGDVFVFLFFGLLSVMGSYFLVANTLNVLIILPAITIGVFSTAVLNLNNLRDFNTDSKSNKQTVIVKYGIRFGKRYHYVLIGLGMVMAISYSILTYHSVLQFLYLLIFLPLIKHLHTVYTTKNTATLDGELKLVALSTFFFAILFSIFN